MASGTNGSVTHTQHSLFASVVIFYLVYNEYNGCNELADRQVSLAGHAGMVVAVVCAFSCFAVF